MEYKIIQATNSRLHLCKIFFYFVLLLIIIGCDNTYKNKGASMKKIIFLLTIFSVLSCASTTYIKTLPPDAKVYEGGALRGVTPYMHFDRSAGMASRTFTLKKEGYKDKTITIEKTDFYIHRLIFPPILAWPWLFGYPYEYFYELEEAVQNNVPSSTKQNAPVSSKMVTQPSKSGTEYTQKLQTLKSLKDQGLLNDEEYEQKRKSIVDGM